MSNNNFTLQFNKFISRVLLLVYGKVSNDQILSECVSDRRFTTSEHFFSYIMARTSYILMG